MSPLPPMTSADRDRVATAVAEAELRSSGEIVTILADRSDSYADVALAWSAIVALVALGALTAAPDFYLAIYERLSGGWIHEWSPRLVFSVALLVAALKFLGTWLILLWRPLRIRMTPAPIRHGRIRARAIAAFRIGAERRTQGRTGVLIYLSLAEHRAEIVADEAIASKVDAEVWGEAMAAMLAELRRGRLADGLIAAITQVGTVLARHLPRRDDDMNELPDRLIEL